MYPVQGLLFRRKQFQTKMPKMAGPHDALIEAVVGFVNVACRLDPDVGPGAPHSVSAANTGNLAGGLVQAPVRWAGLSNIGRRVIPTRPKSRTQNPGQEH